MLRTIFFFTIFWILMILSLLLLIPLIPLSLPPLSRQKEGYVLAITGWWARIVLKSGGVSTEVRGLEHLPEEHSLCFVANHQSYFDIPLIMATIPRIIGFVAKKELRFLPLVNIWMVQIGCVFLDRSSPRQALEVFARGAESIRRGRAKLIFPEGTRSKNGAMGPAKPGALRLAFMSGATVVPITLDGSRKLLEQEGKITPGKVVITIHPPLSANIAAKAEQRQFTDQVMDTIASALPGTNAS